MSQLNILIVEDDPDLRELVADGFSYEGWAVDQAENGSVAIVMILKKKYTCVFSDMRMPQGDGRFLAKKIFELEGEKPLVFIYTGYSEMTSNEIQELEIQEVFNKPMVMSEVMTSINNHLKLTCLES